MVHVDVVECLSMDGCVPSPCVNGATCERGEDDVSYTCHCASGWAGVMCDVNVDDCESDPCQNGAVYVQGGCGCCCYPLVVFVILLFCFLY